MSEKPNIGDIVELESGRKYPVVGYEQGGRTVQLPCGPGGTTREFFHDKEEIEVVEEEANPFQIYQTALNGYPVDHEVADLIASLVIEDVIPKENLLSLHRFLSESQMTTIEDKVQRQS